eukprot:SAG11_NODE_18963_length_477_cov_0.801587_1_plen_29_part_10
MAGKVRNLGPISPDFVYRRQPAEYQIFKD